MNRYPVVRSFFRSLWRGTWRFLTGNIVLLPPSDTVVVARRARCETCVKRATIPGTDFPYCTVCNCALPVKTRIAFEKCPLQYWD